MKKTIKDMDIKGKKVIARVDFNVPLDDKLQIRDDTRIRETLPTIKYMLDQKSKIILMSHLGRPKGKPEEKYSLKPVAKRLGELLKMEIKMAPGCVDAETKKMAAELKEKEILLLENLRFNAGEEKNDPAFAKELASLAEVFIQDAFGTVHRAHASTEGITKFLPSACGFLLEKEINAFDRVLKDPARPFIAILGGAKVSDKIMVIENLMNKVDVLIIGGAMAYTLLKAKGIPVGKSLVEDDKIPVAKDIIKKFEEKKNKVRCMLPIDHIIADRVDQNSEVKETNDVDIPEGWIGVDIGRLTIERLKSIIISAKTIVWNGPMGVFEIEKFSKGTREVASMVAEATQKGAISIVGGGDSVSAVKKMGVADKITHISTGGGASIELLEGKTLPGIAAIQDK